MCFLFKYTKQIKNNFLMLKNKIINNLNFTEILMLNLRDFLVIVGLHKFFKLFLHSKPYHHLKYLYI